MMDRRLEREPTTEQYEINRLASVIAEITLGVKEAVVFPQDFSFAEKIHEMIKKELEEGG